MSKHENAAIKKPTPMLLCILDGWGHSEYVEDNAILAANTPNYDKLLKTYPHALLATSGADVGLPDGQMGNSEVGHMNLGGGRIVKQDLPRIDEAVANNVLKDITALKDHINALKKSGGTCHLLGLVSNGGVHSSLSHIIALAKIISGAQIPVNIHAFLDGRDTPPTSANGFMAELEVGIKDLTNVSIATICGRYYAMDRDQRWDRVELAYSAIAGGKGRKTQSPLNAIQTAYTQNETDEFFVPSVVGNYSGINTGDGLLMANFRADRAREILSALAAPTFDGFNRGNKINFATVAGMVEYSAKHSEFMSAVFAPIAVPNNLGQVVANAGLRQLRIAETEKYAHVTFFFNGGSEEELKGEERILIPSPDVATYDLKPEMSAAELTTKLIGAIKNGAYDLIVVNFANPDMVGHTGILAAAIKAVETIDECLGKIQTSINETGGVMLLTADHGNVEQMLNHETGEAHTAHTSLQVPIILAGQGIKPNVGLNNGCLADVAPTILNLMNIEQPSEMTGKSLLKIS